MSSEITTSAPRASFDLSPTTFEQALTFSNMLADSDMVPKDFKGKPGNCLIAMQWGAELGLKPLQALQNLAIINGRPSLWGDAVIGLVRSSALCEYVIETDDGKVATCTVKRRGEAEQSRTFSMLDAQAAGLAGKSGPWTQYPKRMRQMRARAFAVRDVFPDVLRGLAVAEEVIDTPTDSAKDMGAVPEVSRRPVFDASAWIDRINAAPAPESVKAEWAMAAKDARECADPAGHAAVKSAVTARLAEIARQVEEARTVDVMPREPGADDDFVAEFEANEEKQ